MRKLFAPLLILLLFYPFVPSFSLPNYGLYFKSKEVEKEKRTGFDVTSDGSFHYSGKFSIKFDISFREGEDRFGYIFRLKEKNSNSTIDFVAKLNGDPPNMYLINNHKETNITYTLSEEKTFTNRWIPVEVKFDAEVGSVEVSVNGMVRKDLVTVKPHSEFVLFFGVGNYYSIESDETPPMAIRDLYVTTDGKTTYHWPLERVSGNVVKDSNHKKVAVITNPEWVITYHNHWEKVASFEFKKAPQVVFDEKKGTFYFVFRTKEMYQYSLGKNQYSEVEWLQGFPVWEESHQLIFRNDTLVSYSMNQPLASLFDFKSKSWSYPDNIYTGLPPEWHHNTLIHPVTHQITTICGYGYYTYRNTIESLDLSQHAWVKLAFKGDTIDPRYLAGFGQSVQNPNVGYLFGGLGNETGKQIEGKKFYYDFYRINFVKNRIDRVWTLKERPLVNFTPVNSLLIEDKENCFYSLIFPHDKYKSYLQLVKGDLSHPGISVFGDSIPYNFLDIESFANLYFWNSGNKLITLTLFKHGDKFVVTLYSILFPPLHCPTETEKKLITIRRIISAVIIAIIVLTLVYLLFLWFRRSGKKDVPGQQILPGQESAEVPQISTDLTFKSSIYIFGDFQVFDKNGREITYLFSPTLKELFLLIFLYTHFREKGIKSQRIQEFLWPEKSKVNANNNQGVNIKKLRAVLADIGDVGIQYDNSYWTIPLNDTIFCDFTRVIRFMKTYNSPKTADLGELKKVIGYLNRGAFLPTIEKDWMDDLKNDISSFILSYLENLIDQTALGEDSSLVLELTNAIFKFDKLNEKALKAKCKVLSANGKHNIAMETYEHFVRLYKKCYNEDFGVSFKDLIRK